MDQRKTPRYTLCIVLIATFISTGICCTNLEWACDSGDCITLDELCDGGVNCVDGSDETTDSCIQQSCPKFSFRCAYGACIAGTAVCNGVRDCADNSDETSALCSGDDVSRRNSKCTNDEFPCLSGKCIMPDNACDGFAHCPDQSDETVEACSSNYCPDFAFRCGYGACISSEKKCDGVPDCRDASDEVDSLCGETPIRPQPTPKPPVTGPPRPGLTPKPPPVPPTPAPKLGCIAPRINNSVIFYEADPTIFVKAGDFIPDKTSLVFECQTGYTQEGHSFGLCFNSRWEKRSDTVCVKYCPSLILKGVTFQTSCEYNGETVSCDDRIKPGTLATLTCQVKYRKPELDRPETLVCEDDGNWNYSPFACEPICGEEIPRTKTFAVNAEHTNITFVPWHAGIYKKSSGTYVHVCGSTIIGAKVVLSAAHCFWDNANEKLYDKSLFVVFAGKYYRDYNADERSSQERNISEIAIPPSYQGEDKDYKADIAVIVLTNFLKFSPFVAAVCIEWQGGAAKSILSGIHGLTAGWGIDESGTYSAELRSIELKATGYSDCRAQVGPQLSNAVTTDKFCVLNEHGSALCQGDSGGGFTMRRNIGGKIYHYLWGVVSVGVPIDRVCRAYDFATYTNIQFYENMINSRIALNRPK